jgi:hypothetical protein
MGRGDINEDFEYMKKMRTNTDEVSETKSSNIWPASDETIDNEILFGEVRSDNRRVGLSELHLHLGFVHSTEIVEGNITTEH